MPSSVIDSIKNLDELPTLPTIAVQVLSLVQAKEVDIQELSATIHQDPSLSARILRIANSAFYRRGTRSIETIHRSIMLLGLNEIVDIISSISVLTTFPYDQSQDQSLRRSFWDHCVGTAIIAKKLAANIGLPTEGREYVAGLLHDIGKIIMDEYYHEPFLAAHTLSNERFCPMYEAEYEIMQTNHMEIGNILAHRWQLPDYVADAILWHHQPSKARYPELTALISISNLLAKATQLSCGGDSMSFVLADQEGWQILRSRGYPLENIDIERLTFELTDSSGEIRDYVTTCAAEEGNADGRV